jgi:hypothetical protein
MPPCWANRGDIWANAGPTGATGIATVYPAGRRSGSVHLLRRRKSQLPVSASLFSDRCGKLRYRSSIATHSTKVTV